MVAAGVRVWAKVAAAASKAGQGQGMRRYIKGRALPLARGPRRPGAAGLCKESELVPSSGMTPTGGSHLSAVEEKGKEAPGRIGLGNGKRAGGIFLCRGEKRERGKEEMGRLG